MSHELKKREDRLTIQRRLKYTCGWTSKELAWQAESDRRLWKSEHDPAKTLRNWIAKHQRNESTVQTLPEDKFEEYVKALSKPIALTQNTDGFLHHGDVIRLRWAYGENPTYLACLPNDVDEAGNFQSPSRATATEDSRTLVRSTCYVYRKDVRIPATLPLMYGECIFICTPAATGKLLLNSELKTYEKYASLSGHQEVTWSTELSGRALWKVCLPGRNTDGLRRGQYILVNDDVVLNHVVTNQNLAVEGNWKISSVMGLECEVTAHNASSKGKEIGKENIWQFEAELDAFVFGGFGKDHSSETWQPSGVLKQQCFTAEEAKFQQDVTKRFYELLNA